MLTSSLRTFPENKMMLKPRIFVSNCVMKHLATDDDHLVIPVYMFRLVSGSKSFS